MDISKQNIDDPLENARLLQAQAQDIIEEIGLVRNWSQVGKVFLVGSSRFGLMVRHNIDLEIYTPSPGIDTGFDVVKRFAKLPGTRHIDYYNFLDTADPGLYWHIFYQDRLGIVWDIDNWLIPDSHPHAGLADRFADKMSKALTDDARRTILRIKSALPQGSGIRGIDIYKAVLSCGIKDPAAFDLWIKANPPVDGIETWQPS